MMGDGTAGTRPSRSKFLSPTTARPRPSDPQGRFASVEPVKTFSLSFFYVKICIKNRKKSNIVVGFASMNSGMVTMHLGMDLP